MNRASATAELARRANDDPSVRQLLRGRPASRGEACSPCGAARGESKGVRTRGAEHGFHHRASLFCARPESASADSRRAKIPEGVRFAAADPLCTRLSSRAGLLARAEPILPPDAARRRHLVALAEAKAAAPSRRAAADRRYVCARRRGRRARLRGRRRLRDDELLRGELSVARAHHRARSARRRRVPRPLPGHPLRPGRRVRAALRGRRVRHRLLERGDRARGWARRASASSSRRRSGSDAASFITTPNRRFPVEVHTRLPIVHWLPDAVSHRVYRATGREFATDVHLLTRRSFAALFPGRVRIVEPRHDAGGDRRLGRVASSESRSAFLVVGLALHNVAMAQLWELGVRGTWLDVAAAWKEAILLVALLVVAWHVRRKPAVTAADVLAASYAIVIAVYWLIPQDVLGGEATARGELLALRHHLFPVAAYALGRLVAIAWEERGRVGRLRRARGSRRRGRRSPRPHVRLAAGVARLGRPRLVRRAARARLRGPLRAPRELGLQHGRRGESDPSARLHVPLAARECVRPRRRADLRRQPAAALVVGGARRAALRRASLHAHTRSVRCARVRARRARRSRSAALRRRCSASRRSSRARSSSSPTRRSGRPRATRPTSSSCFARTRGRKARRSRADGSPPRTRPRRATGATCATACES